MVFLSLLLAGSPAHADGIGHADRVVNRVNAVFSEKERLLALDDNVFQNEIVNTDVKSASRLKFLDKSQLSIGPSSSIVLDSFVYNDSKTPDKVVANMAVGVMRWTSGTLGKKAYQVRTPVATIGIRGTVFDTVVEQNGTTHVIVHSGEIIIRDRKGREQIVGPCGFATVLASPPEDADDGPSAPQSVLRLPNDIWNRIRDMDTLLTPEQVEPAGGKGCALGGTPTKKAESSPGKKKTNKLPDSFIPFSLANGGGGGIGFIGGGGGGNGGSNGGGDGGSDNGGSGPNPPIDVGTPNGGTPPGGGSGGDPTGGNTPPGGGNTGGGGGNGGNGGNNPPDPTPPVLQSVGFKGIAFNASENPDQTDFRFTQVVVGDNPVALNPLPAIPDPLIGQVAFDLMSPGGVNDIDRIGGLDGGQLIFKRSTEVIQLGPGASMIITGGNLLMDFIPGHNIPDVVLPYDLGMADSTYLLGGWVSFLMEIVIDGITYSFEEILTIDATTIDGTPFNTLAVGSDQSDLDISFYLLGFGDVDCGGCLIEGLPIEFYFAGTTSIASVAEVPAPATILILLAGLGCLVIFRRKA